jgi:hypothetical protein
MSPSGSAASKETETTISSFTYLAPEGSVAMRSGVGAVTALGTAAAEGLVVCTRTSRYLLAGLSPT